MSADPAATPPPSRLVIRPRRGWLAIDWRALWEYRELLYFLTWRDIKVRYKQTVLGVLWAVLQPLVKMVVLTLIFGGMMRSAAGLDTDRWPYPVFLFAGMLPWQFFAESLRRSAESIVREAQIIGRVYFPRLLVPLASTGSALVDFVLNFVVLLGIMAAFGVWPGVRIAAVVPLAVVTAVAALGAGTLLSALTVAYRDFRYVIPFLVETWFFVTPVIWPLSDRPQWRLLLALNPMCGVVEAYRWAVLPGWSLDLPVLGVSAAVSVLMFFAALYIFRRLERQFADII